TGALIGNGNYVTLTTAFNAINSGAQTSSNIIIDINANIFEPFAGAILNGGTWTSLLIRPNGGGARTVSGDINAGASLVDLNGADNVTIDGLHSGGNFMTFATVVTLSPSTIRFRGGALNNKVTRCTILGSTNSVPSAANVFFSTGNT